MPTILITGGSGKIGGRLVDHFLREGWNVVFTSRSTDAADRLQSRFSWVPEMRARARVQAVNMYADDFTDKLIEAAESTPIDVLVNNARSLDTLAVGEEGLSERRHLMDEYLFDVVIPYELSTGLLSNDRHPLTRIINVGSIYGIVPFNPYLYGERYPGAAPIQYGLAKAALHQLTKELAIRYRGRCRVNTVTYGGVEGRVTPEFQERYARLCPEERMLSEEEVTGPVAFLASTASASITGQNIIQDGGWTVW